jgi:tRNA modification GTPase
VVHGPSGGEGQGSLTPASETIVAIATAPGSGALGVIRVSGPRALAAAAALVANPSQLHAQPSHTVRRVRLLDLDDALCTVMRAPRSYTGEDVVELSCHGSPPLLAAVVERLRQAGARVAHPGEFTRRAFLNGRLGLAEAEAVALVIGARSERALRLAARARQGAVAQRVYHLREALLDLVSGMEVGLDFPDDHVGVDGSGGAAIMKQLCEDVRVLVEAARRGRKIQDGVTIAIVGRPNAGKSSLLNALLGRDRAIVAPTPGTTRDVVEGTIDVRGVSVRLLDTAGLGAAADAVEAEGMRRTRVALAESDIALLVVDGVTDEAPQEDELGGTRVVVVRSKSDVGEHRMDARALSVSSITGAGLPQMLERLGDEIERLVEGDEGQIAASLRQEEALEALLQSLRDAEAALATMPLEVVLVDLRRALQLTSALLGVELGDAVLDRIFATFCVGK